MKNKKEIMELLRNEMAITGGELLYREQVIRVLINIGIHIGKVDAFIKGIMKKDLKAINSFKIILLGNGFKSDDVNYFINLISNTNLQLESHEIVYRHLCYTRMKMFNITGERKNRVEKYLVSKGFRKKAIDGVLDMKLNDFLDKEMIDIVSTYFGINTAFWSGYLVSYNKELFEALDYTSDEYYNEELEQIICLKCVFPKESCNCAID